MLNRCKTEKSLSFKLYAMSQTCRSCGTSKRKKDLIFGEIFNRTYIRLEYI